MGATLLAEAKPTHIDTWKTGKAWSGTCRQLIVQLVDGTEHRAYLRFVK